MNKAKWLSCVAVTVMAFLLLNLSCSKTAIKAVEDEQALELRSYPVPPEYASEVSSIINSLLSQEGKEKVQLGKARIGPGGVVLVTAPASMQPGIEKMIADLGKVRPEPTPMVSITYWIVVGKPAKETTWPSSLNEIAPALKAVSASEGSMSFALQERLKLQSLSGEPATLGGRTAQVQQQATVRENSVVGNLDIRMANDMSFRSRVQIGIDKLLVLGQSGVRSSRFTSLKSEPEPDPEASFFYIIRASSESGGPR